ncbi:histidine phosphatase family protein [Paenibacillus cremeus]|uniref:histidine phosphatase family protein n=1 Tax=Paenibacillus cremeus TaxID=2163881 RepID=UPI0021BD00F4|nr:histidine phosphatase family protein [Paenibacillus cremeus]
MVKTIYLVRHCKAEGQEPDALLTVEGRRQAEELAEFLKHTAAVEVVVSSPFVRAVETIRPFCEQRACKLQVDARLEERVLSTESMPDWMDRLKRTYDDLHLAFPGGESSYEAMRRGIEVLQELLARPESECLVVTHGALLTLLLKHYDPRVGFAEWKGLTNPNVFQLIFETEAGAPTIRRVWDAEASLWFAKHQ